MKFLTKEAMEVVALIRRTAGVPLLLCGRSPLESRAEFAYPVRFSERFKNWIYTNYITL